MSDKQVASQAQGNQVIYIQLTVWSHVYWQFVVHLQSPFGTACCTVWVSPQVIGAYSGPPGTPAHHLAQKFYEHVPLPAVAAAPLRPGTRLALRIRLGVDLLPYRQQRLLPCSNRKRLLTGSDK